MSLPLLNAPAGLRERQLKATARPRRDWYRFEAKSDGESADLYIFDEISFWGISAQDFVRDLNAVTAKTVNLHLNSPGGDVFDGIAIHNALKAHPAAINVTVEGIAASIASVIAMAGDRVEMATYSSLMIHDPWGLAIGNAAELRDLADVLDGLGDTIARVYADRAEGRALNPDDEADYVLIREWRDRMLAETWYTDQGAVHAGLADAVAGQKAAENRFDLSLFANAPEHLRGTQPPGRSPATKRDAERALRDAGLSHSQAKALIAAGWGEIEPTEPPRDVADWSLLHDSLTAALGGTR